jgi:hypothetical protein
MGSCIRRLCPQTRRSSRKTGAWSGCWPRYIRRFPWSVYPCPQSSPEWTRPKAPLVSKRSEAYMGTTELWGDFEDLSCLEKGEGCMHSNSKASTTAAQGRMGIHQSRFYMLHPCSPPSTTSQALESAPSSPLPNADIVSAFADLMSSLWLPVRDSFESTVTRRLTLFPNSEALPVILNILAGLIQMRKIGLGSESPRRSTSRGRLVRRKFETNQATIWR